MGRGAGQRGGVGGGRGVWVPSGGQSTPSHWKERLCRSSGLGDRSLSLSPAPPRPHAPRAAPEPHARIAPPPTISRKERRIHFFRYNNDTVWYNTLSSRCLRPLQYRPNTAHIYPFTHTSRPTLPPDHAHVGVRDSMWIWSPELMFYSEKKKYVKLG